MAKKLYSISELINENIKLKKQIEKQEIANIESIINLIRVLRLAKPIEFDRIEEAYKLELRRI